jgi:hypothetical protein
MFLYKSNCYFHPLDNRTDNNNPMLKIKDTHQANSNPNKLHNNNKFHNNNQHKQINNNLDSTSPLN